MDSEDLGATWPGSARQSRNSQGCLRGGWSQRSLERGEMVGRRLFTHGSMLKRECNGILHSLDRNGLGIAGKPLADNDLNSADLIGRTPIALAEQFASKLGKLQGLELSILGKIFLIISPCVVGPEGLLVYRSYG